jgi:predicted DNA-binding transcriptional regulator AlpA
MSTITVQDGIETVVCVPQRVSISRWVNEPCLAWDRILTAHDVARLIRRPPWMLCSMAVVGQFPRRQRFRGKNIGWLTADILEWMARTSGYSVSTTSDKTNCCRRHRPNPPNRQMLPLHYAPARALSGHDTDASVVGGSP